MARSVILNGTTYSIPQTGDSGWSQSGGVDDFLYALGTGAVLTKSGGTFTISSEVDLGGANTNAYGLKSNYFKSRTTNAASVGALRLAKTDSVGWRNNANSADIALAIDASDNLTFNGTKVGLSGNIVNADINAAAAIAYSKLALAGAIQNSDLAGSIAYSKLILTGSIVNADVSATAAIAYSKLNLAGAVKLASDVTGLLPAANGGTGVNSTATFPASGVVVTEAGTETLTNKTLTSPVISSIVNTGTLTLPTSTDTLVGRATTDTLINKTLTAPVQSSYEDFTQIATPASPASGKDRLYFKSDDNLYSLTSAGIEKQIGSGAGGSGQKNYISTSASSTAATWSVYGTVAASTDTTAADLPRATTTASGWKLAPSGSTSGTFTCTSATPAVLTATAHGMQTGYTVTVSNAGGGLPTGLTAGTVYYVNVLSSSTFNVATTMANLLAGTYVATSSTGTGTQSFTFGGAYLRFTLDAADYGVKQQLQWAQNILSGAAGDWEVDIYSNTASNYTGTYTHLPLSTDSSGSTSLPNLEGTFRTTFDAPGSAQQYIELRFNKLAANTHALVGSDLIVGPGTTVQGPAVSTWQSYTPTIAGVTTSANVAQWRKVGDTIEVEGSFTASGTSTATVTASLPNNYTINTTALASGGTSNDTLGSGIYSASTITTLYVTYGTSTTVSFGGTGNASRYGSSVTIASPNTIDYRYTVPVNELAGSGTVNVAQNEEEYAFNTDTGTTANTAFSDAASTGYGPGGTAVNSIASTTTTGNAVTSYIVQFQRPFSATDRLILEVLRSSSNIWEDVNGTELRYLQQGTASYGLGLYRGFSSTTQVLVQFGNAGAVVGTTYGAAGTAWSTYTGYKWRVRKQGGVGTVGFGTVVPGSSAGLVSASGVPGNATGNAIASQFVGELIKGNASATNAPAASGSYTNVVILSLTAGIWDVQGGVVLSIGTMSGLTTQYCAISLTSVNTDVATCEALTQIPATTTSFISTPVRRLLITGAGTTNVYLVAGANYTTVGTANYGTSCFARATRVA